MNAILHIHDEMIYFIMSFRNAIEHHQTAGPRGFTMQQEVPHRLAGKIGRVQTTGLIPSMCRV